MADDTKLVTGLRQLLGHSYAMYFRAHSAHWNIEGQQFITLHGFFGDLYTDVFSAIDNFAESIRQHKATAPHNLAEILKYSSFTPAASGDGSKLLEELLELNTKMRTHLAFVRGLAEDANDWGLANFVQDREAAHLKWDWQIRMLLT